MTKTIKPVKLQARELIRLAKRHKVTLADVDKKIRDGRYSTSGYLCVRQLLSRHHEDGDSMYVGAYDREKLINLEDGFENWPFSNKNNKYYKVGQNIRKILGLDN